MANLIENKEWEKVVSEIKKDENLWEEMIRNKRSKNTQRAYEVDMKDFFKYHGVELSQNSVIKFLSLSKLEAVQLVLKFRQHLTIQRKLKPASIARKLSAIKALAKYAYDIGYCQWKLDVEPLAAGKIETYRDTRGISSEEINQMLESLDRSMMVGKRDYAIFKLLWCNGLRRAEVTNLDVEDIDVFDRSLWILGKGKVQKVQIKMNTTTTDAISEWLQDRNNYYHLKSDALFISLSNINRGERLSAQSIYNLVDRTAKKLGIKKLSPHQIRHSAITKVLELNGGNLVKAKDFSRHQNVNTLMIYYDNLGKSQQEMSDLLD